MSGAERGSSRPRTSVRTAMVWQALAPVLGEHSDRSPLDVVDIGGGTGVSAVRVAALGHRVVVVDPSPDALAALGRRAQEAGCSDRITGHQGDATSLLDVVEEGSADVVLCHGVLEYVEDPASALAVVARVLRPGGTLSLLAAQRHAAVIARAMAGHFAQARDLLEQTPPGVRTADRPERSDRPPASGREGRSARSGGRGTGHRFTAEDLRDLLDGAGLQVTAVQGVRVFADLVPGSLLDLEPGSGAALLDLERAVAERAEFLPLATQVHLLATR